MVYKMKQLEQIINSNREELELLYMEKGVCEETLKKSQEIEVMIVALQKLRLEQMNKHK